VAKDHVFIPYHHRVAMEVVDAAATITRLVPMLPDALGLRDIIMIKPTMEPAQLVDVSDLRNKLNQIR
jgi:hypothetical protein